MNFENNWTTPLKAYLRSGILPDGKEAIRKLKVQASRFVIIRDVLYKKGFSQPYLRCLSHEKADYVMREVHKGICGNHSGERSLVHKLIRAWYYWPTMLKDAQAYVKTYNKCQRFSNLIRQPSEELTPMTAPWPFAQWGLDIMGPFQTALRQLKFLVVGIDYFTKWVEAEALATITKKNIRSFVWRNPWRDSSLIDRRISNSTHSHLDHESSVSTGYQKYSSSTMENNSTTRHSGTST